MGMRQFFFCQQSGKIDTKGMDVAHMVVLKKVLLVLKIYMINVEAAHRSAQLKNSQTSLSFHQKVNYVNGGL